MNKYQYFFSIFLIAAILFLFSQKTEAQFNVNIPGALQNELGFELIPSYPAPYQNVYINLSLYTNDLNSAKIVWLKDGKVDQEGIGLTRYSFRTGKVGEEIRIEVVIVLNNGVSFNKNFTINPASVDIAWEADSYTPPFYQGKALHPRQGRFKLVATPEFYKNNKRIAPENLVYNWSLGEDALEGQSGYGKKTVIVDGNLLGDTERIYLLVTDPNNNISAESYLDITPTEPEILFYENNSYYGYLSDNALTKTIDLSSSEIQIVLEPYFITRDGNLLEYKWRLNGRNASELNNSRSAVFRKPEGEEGESLIRVNINNLQKILQFADESLKIRFTN